MKILMVNNHFFNYRGADRYFFNIKSGLEKAGHKVIPFSFRYEATQETPYLPYFPEPITGPGPFLLKDMRLSIPAKARTAVKMFFNPEVDGKFRKVLRETKPDLVYTIYLSFTFLPRLLKIAKREFGLPVLYRLSDYHMFCASYLFFRDNQSCTECLTKPWAAVRHKCMHGSRFGSFLRALQIRFNRWRKDYGNVDYFICPSKYMRETLIQHGPFAEDRVKHLPTFTGDLLKDAKAAPPGKPYALYFGAIVPAKGMDVLVKAFNRMANPAFGLRLVGDVEKEYQDHLLNLLDEAHRPLVSMDGELKGEALWETLRGATCVIHPVLWFENMPNSILEAMSAGKPIIASAIGSMMELVEEGVNGSLVPPGDAEALAQALGKAADQAWVSAMSKGARERYLRDHTPEKHLAALTGLMEGLVGKNPASVPA